MNDLYMRAYRLDFGKDMCRQNDAVLLAELADQGADLADLDRVQPTVGSSRITTLACE